MNLKGDHIYCYEFLPWPGKSPKVFISLLKHANWLSFRDWTPEQRKKAHGMCTLMCMHVNETESSFEFKKLEATDGDQGRELENWELARTLGLHELISGDLMIVRSAFWPTWMCSSSVFVSEANSTDTVCLQDQGSPGVAGPRKPHHWNMSTTRFFC